IRCWGRHSLFLFCCSERQDWIVIAVHSLAISSVIDPAYVKYCTRAVRHKDVSLGTPWSRAEERQHTERVEWEGHESSAYRLDEVLVHIASPDLPLEYRGCALDVRQ